MPKACHAAAPGRTPEPGHAKARATSASSSAWNATFALRSLRTTQPLGPAAPRCGALRRAGSGLLTDPPRSCRSRRPREVGDVDPLRRAEQLSKYASSSRRPAAGTRRCRRRRCRSRPAPREEQAPAGRGPELSSRAGKRDHRAAHDRTTCAAAAAVTPSVVDVTPSIRWLPGSRAPAVGPSAGPRTIRDRAPASRTIRRPSSGGDQANNALATPGSVASARRPSARSIACWAAASASAHPSDQVKGAAEAERADRHLRASAASGPPSRDRISRHHDVGLAAGILPGQ